MYRLYNRTGFHLYTADVHERDSFLSDLQFQDEGIEGYAIKINSNAACPTTPSETYPVYRLFHADNFKYRLVSGSALKNQLLTQGYVDEGILFCATAVSAASLTGSGASCSWTWADDFAPARPMSMRPVFRNMACTTANDGQKQNVTDGTADWTCTCDEAAAPPVVVTPPVYIPPVSGTVSCNFGSTTLAHGATATGYSTVTAPCASQAVTCTNGVLGNPSFRFDSCSAAPVTGPVVSDGCPNRAPNVEIAISKHYQRMVTGGWDNMTSPAIPHIYTSMSAKGSQYLVKLVVTSTDTTMGTAASALPSVEFGEQGVRTTRILNISRSKCDYGSIPASENGRISDWTMVSINDPGRTDDNGRAIQNLTTGVWYVNIKNTVGPGELLLEWRNYLGGN